MSKGFKTDGFKLVKDFMATGIFSDVRVYKDRGYIAVIAVKDGLIIQGSLGTAFKDFKNQEEVQEAIDGFIGRNSEK